MAAAKVLLHSIAVRDPETFEVSVLLAGTKKSDVPDWAKVHEDNFGTPSDDSDDSGDSTGGDATSFDSMKLPELKAEIEKRNADREDDAKLSTTGNKGDLVAALVADDEAQASA